MNPETEKTMSRPEAINAPKRTAELEELLIDAEADDEQVQRHQNQPQQQQPRPAHQRMALLHLLVIGLGVDQQLFELRRALGG